MFNLTKNAMTEHNKKLEKLNEKMAQNNLPPLSPEDWKNMNRFKKAYELELERTKKNRKLDRVVALVLIGIMLALWALIYSGII